MGAYYKVAMKSVIDSFGIYAVEECLLKELANLFTPQTVLQLDDSVVSNIAGESEESLAEREDLNRKLKVLEMTMTTLRRMKNFKRSGKRHQRRSQGSFKADRSTDGTFSQRNGERKPSGN
jgi:hypothetical protein